MDYNSLSWRKLDYSFLELDYDGLQVYYWDYLNYSELPILQMDYYRLRCIRTGLLDIRTGLPWITTHYRCITLDYSLLRLDYNSITWITWSTPNYLDYKWMSSDYKFITLDDMFIRLHYKWITRITWITPIVWITSEVPWITVD